ncbi:glycosyltransferase [Candidatus Microgenomates bacterium]|nr:MAG: glycosyltransferase [Candidatus Microgenomates bacterium]
MTEKITVIIPTYNNYEGLEYLLKLLSYWEVKVIVMDNQPSSNKKELAEKYKTSYYAQQENLGFARVVNKAVSLADTDWVLILNDDVIFPLENHLHDYITFATKKGWVAASPILKKLDSTVENAGYRVLRHGKVELNFDIHNLDIDGLSGTCLLFRTKVFQKLSGFDESIFAYLEDVELFMRIKNLEFPFGVLPYEVTHGGMVTSYSINHLKPKMDFRNWIRIINKHRKDKRFAKSFLPLLLERARNFSGLVKAYLYGNDLSDRKRLYLKQLRKAKRQLQNKS